MGIDIPVKERVLVGFFLYKRAVAFDKAFDGTLA